tara:strand:- start:83 stop:373 length:291 start_codon:yes stop_codon:yes gene_type:complete
MKDETKYLIEEMKQKQRLDEIYKSRIIEFDDYFTYSGKEEMRVKKFKADAKNYSAIVDSDVVNSLTVPTMKLQTTAIYNDMSKYKLKKKRILWLKK